MANEGRRTRQIAEDDFELFLFDCQYAANYWKLLERNLRIIFKRRDGWKEGLWTKERKGYERET
ncbi:hypothetical protein Cni_G01806 [Canna indica]|uniref:Uncharacterized protein n=1 Tax=Canna indica TaxID=4628 RepID=A0AAQ3PZ69_9LILI|nr:hypothetical protein Cni_G01806 [Canna indica]